MSWLVKQWMKQLTSPPLSAAPRSTAENLSGRGARERVILRGEDVSVFRQLQQADSAVSAASPGGLSRRQVGCSPWIPR